jgi:hypothetical protein
MPARSRTRVSNYIRQNAIALLALFFAVSGGTAMALDGSNTVFSDDIAPQEVKVADLAQGSVISGKLAVDSVNSGKVVNGSLQGDDILDATIGGIDIADNAIRGEDVNESTLGQVPDAEDADNAGFAQGASLAFTANTARNLRNASVYVKTASVVVPGGDQTSSNGNGFSRAVSVSCNTNPSTLFPDVAMGGGAFWSGNANSNSDELENRIHSATYLNLNGTPAAAGDFPFGYRVRGEVDKDGDDTLTVQVVCYPTLA